MLELVVHREEAKEEVCVIDDKFITVGEEKGPQLLQEVSTNGENCGKHRRLNLKAKEPKQIIKWGQFH